MNNSRIFWLSLATLVLLTLVGLYRASSIRPGNPMPGSALERGPARPAKDRSPVSESATSPGIPAHPPQAGPSGEAKKVWDLLQRYGLDRAALNHAQRAAFQAAEFRRLATNAFARVSYLPVLVDREKLHLDLEFGITNAAFLDELFSLDLTETPPAERPETLMPTLESQIFYEYNRRIQGTSAGIHQLTDLLAERGLSGFPLVLRAAEDLALLGFCEERHASIETTRKQWLDEPEPNAATRASVEAQATADIAASREGVEAFWKVVAGGFNQLSGGANQDLYTHLRTNRIDAIIRPVRPPVGETETIRELKPQAPPVDPQQP